MSKIILNEEKYINEIAKLHKSQFNGYDILSSGSIKLIKSFYKSILKLNSTILIAEIINDRIVGFLYFNIGDNSPVRSFIKKNKFRILSNPFYFKQILKSLINKLLQNTVYSYHNELVYIAIDKEFTGRGIASGLINLCEEELRKRKINEYYLQVFKKNERAVKLYNHLGFQVLKNLDRISFDKYIMKKKLY